MSKTGVPRRGSLDAHGIRRLGSRERGFRFVTAEKKPVSNEVTLARIRSLHIPPAWREVRIARLANAPLQAVGLDKKGRTQYLYHARFRQSREEEKFQRVVEFGESLPMLRRKIRSDLHGSDLSKEQVLAAIVRLIDQGFFRVGNDKSARSEDTYGLTTVRSDHVDVQGSKITFEYLGKWRKSQRRQINDAEIASIVRKLSKVEGGELFKFFQGGRIRDVKDRHVNEYIQSIIGEKFTAKDFRTWAGTLLCSLALGHHGTGATKKERKKKIKTAIDFTSSQLGNTPAVCRASYICPRLVDEYMEGKEFKPARKEMRGRPVAKVGLSLEERALLRFLRQTIADRRSRQERRGKERGGDRREESGGR